MVTKDPCWWCLLVGWGGGDCQRKNINIYLLKDHILLCVLAQGYVPELSLVCLLKLACNVTFSAGLTNLFCKVFIPFPANHLVFPKLFWQTYWHFVDGDDGPTADSTWLESRFYRVSFPRDVIQISAPMSLALLCKWSVWKSLRYL